MGHGYKHGAGGSALNFNVKTYPSETELKADKPKENTIGVITTTTMTSWVFSATEPTEPEVGMVWIVLGTSSHVEFNALKSKTLQVYPLEAKQYVGGKFETVTAMSYPNGEWVEWIPAGALYWHGDQRETITGGWVERGASPDGSATSKIGEVTCGEKFMELTAIAPSGSNAQGFVYASTKNLIDLTNKKTVSFDVSSFTKTTNEGLIGIYKNTEQWKLDSSTRAAHTTFEEAGVHSIDVTSLSGSYYVGAMLYTTDNTNPAKLTVDEVWME